MNCSGYCDLHAHSCFSDGSCTPEEIVKAACDAGLRGVALTDHNTVSGLPDFTAAAGRYGIQAVCGCEFSTDYLGKELHILGLFLPRDSWDAVAAYTEIRNRRKARSNRDCTERLARAGYDISYDDILAGNPGASINRVHIARALLAKGYVSSVKDAFDRFLQPEHGFFREPARLDAFDTIRHIKDWGGAAVWAHPLISASPAEIGVFIPEAKSAGLDGIETLYSLYSPEDTRYMEALARKYGLLPGGGSDFHGANKPDIALGTGRGDLRVPVRCLTALAARASNK